METIKVPPTKTLNQEKENIGLDAPQKHYCSVPVIPEIVFDININAERRRAILSTEYKWMNGTVLHYYFFDKETDGETVLLTNGEKRWVTWQGAEAQKKVVREAFNEWKSIGVGLEFIEVHSRDEAEIRIGFMEGDGSWSYIGTYILKIGPNARTMNFGWDLLQDPDAAIHEIGHTLGFNHEHQNPKAGIVWNEKAVYEKLSGYPNFWDQETIYNNIISKLQVDSVQGSAWDPNSIMHYPFEKGLIKEPPQYSEGLSPAGGLSERDKGWVRSFYPPLDNEDLPSLLPSQSVQLALNIGEQQNFVIEPEATRTYVIQTFGACDTTIALFEEDNGELRYRTCDDDGGEDRNAKIRVKLFSGRKYVLRARLKYSDLSTPPALMMW